MLGKLKFEINYSKSRQDIYECFYKPAMENSVKYDRVTGYFGSSIFLDGGNIFFYCVTKYII